MSPIVSVFNSLIKSWNYSSLTIIKSNSVCLFTPFTSIPQYKSSILYPISNDYILGTKKKSIVFSSGGFHLNMFSVGPITYGVLILVYINPSFLCGNIIPVFIILISNGSV